MKVWHLTDKDLEKIKSVAHDDRNSYCDPIIYCKDCIIYMTHGKDNIENNDCKVDAKEILEAHRKYLDRKINKILLEGK